MLLRIETRADNEGQVSVIVLLPISGDPVFQVRMQCFCLCKAAEYGCVKSSREMDDRWRILSAVALYEEHITGRIHLTFWSSERPINFD